VAGNAETTHTILFAVIKPSYATKLTVSGSSSVKVRKSCKLTASISPSSATGTVKLTLTRLVGRKWKSAGSANLTPSGGRLSYTFKPKYKGSWRAAFSYGGKSTDSVVYLAASPVTKAFKVR
jgi:hypothetical protein